MTPEWLQHISANFKEYASIAGAVIAAAGGIVSVLASYFARLNTLRRIRASDALRVNIQSEVPGVFVGRHATRDTAEKLSPYLVARERVRERLAEAESTHDEQKSVAWWSTVASVLLTIGQYIVGGLLASSFVQTSLTPRLVGILGLIVLFCSICKQHSHPEVNATTAKNKAAQLRALIRSSQDELSILEARTAAGQDHTDAMIALMKQLTQRLFEIENQQPQSKKLILVNGK